MEIYGERSVYLSSLRSADVAMVAVMEEPKDHEAKVGQYCVCVCVCSTVNGVQLYVLVSVWWHHLLRCHQTIYVLSLRTSLLHNKLAQPTSCEQAE